MSIGNTVCRNYLKKKKKVCFLFIVLLTVFVVLITKNHKSAHNALYCTFIISKIKNNRGD